MRILRRIVFCGLFIFTQFYIPKVVAEDIANVFQVEIIFFEHNDPGRYAAEKWPKNVGSLATAKTIKLNNLPQKVPDSLDTLQILDALDEVDDEPINEVVADTVTIVDKKHLLLTNNAQLIKNSKEERFIDHVAWNQAFAANVKSTPVYIRAGKDSEEIRSVVSVKPVRGQYQMHIDTIFTDINNDKNNSTGITEFRFTADPKLKRKEVYYLDHPIFGAIIIVSPVVENY